MPIAVPLRTAQRRPVAYGRLDDARLARLAAQGDERAFEAIFDRHHASLLAFCRHMLGTREEGEDALQQTFLRAHRALVEHGPPAELRPWLFAIARNRCRTLLAARRDGPMSVEDLERVSVDGLADVVQSRDELRALVADLARLPEDQRGALVLAELGDLTHEQIATVLEVPVSKVKALVFQARETLIAERAARMADCREIRAELAVAHGGALRRGPLRRHLRQCAGCREFQTAVKRQRSALGVILPVAPSVGLKAGVLSALGGGGAASGGLAAGAAVGGAAGEAIGAAAGGAPSVATAVGGLAAKGAMAKLALTAVVATAGVGGGAVAVTQVGDDHDAPPPAARSVPQTVAPAATQATTVADEESAPAAAQNRAARKPGGRRGAAPRAKRAKPGKPVKTNPAAGVRSERVPAQGVPASAGATPRSPVVVTPVGKAQRTTAAAKSKAKKRRSTKSKLVRKPKPRPTPRPQRSKRDDTAEPEPTPTPSG